MSIRTAAFLLTIFLWPAAGLAGLGPPPPAADTPDPDRCSRATPQFCLNGVSGSVTSLDSLRTSVTTPRGCSGAAAAGQDGRGCEQRAGTGDGQKSGGLRAPLLVAAASGASGLLAAEQPSWGLWASYGRSKSKGTVPAAPYTAELDSVRIGVDRPIGQRFVLGAALSAERGDTTTRFNGGGEDSDAYTAMPYFLVMLDDTFSIDVNAGLGRNKVSQNRIDPANGSTLNSRYDGTRRFWSATLNASRGIGNWLVGGRAGFLDAREHQDGYTESGGPSVRTVGQRALRLAQVYAGVDVAYAFTGNIEAYVSTVLRHDVSRNDGATAGGLPGTVTSPQPADRTGFDWTVGLRLFSRRTVSGYLEFMRTEGRERFENKAVNVLVRLDL